MAAGDNGEKNLHLVTPYLEGWSFKMGVLNEADVTISGLKKLQNGATISVDNATLTMNLRPNNNNRGNDDGTLDITLTNGGVFNLNIGYRVANESNKPLGVGATTVDYGSITATSVNGTPGTTAGQFNIATIADTYTGTRTFESAFTINASLEDLFESTETTQVHTATLLTYTSDIAFSNFVTNIQGAYVDAGNVVLTADDEDNIGKYSIVTSTDDQTGVSTVTLYYVTGQLSTIVWNGTAESNSWTGTSWTKGGNSSGYDDKYSVKFDTLREGVSGTVQLTGGELVPTKLTLNDAYTFEVTADTSLAPQKLFVGEDASITKTGSAVLTVNDTLAKGVSIEVGAGTLALDSTLSIENTGVTELDYSNIKLDGGTFRVGVEERSNNRSGAKILLDSTSTASGTLNVTGGQVNMNKDTGSSFGSAKLLLSGSAGITVDTSGTTISNAVELAAGANSEWIVNSGKDVTVGTFSGASTATLNKTGVGTLKLTGSITSLGTLQSSGGGTVELSGTDSIGKIWVGTGEVTLMSGANVTVDQVRLGNNNNQGADVKSVLRISNGATLNINGTMSSATLNDTSPLLLCKGTHKGAELIVEDGGTLNASGIIAQMHINNTANTTTTDNKGTLTINGGTVNLKGLQFWGNGNGGNGVLGGTLNLGTAAAGSGTLNLGSFGMNNVGAYSVLNLGNGTIATTATATIGYNANLTAGKVNLIGRNGGTKFNIDGTGNTLTFEMAVNGTVTGGVSSNDGDLVKQGTGKLVFNKALATSGTLTIEAGTVELKGATTLGHAITNNGTLTLTGDNATLAFTGLTGTLTGYKDGEDVLNGYRSYDYTIIAPSGSGTSTVNGLTAAKVTVNGSAVSALTDNSVATVYSAAGDYYVNNGEVQYGGEEPGNSAAATATTGIVMNGGSLVMKESLTSQCTNGISLNQNATVKLDGADVSLSRSQVTTNSHTLTLGGTGNYTIDTTAGTNITFSEQFDSDWDGQLTLNGGTLTGTDLNKAGSMTLSGVKLNVTAGTYATDLALQGDKMVIAGAGTLDAPYQLTLSGAISGDTNIVSEAHTSGSANVHQITFSGDISGWHGSFTREGSNSGEYYQILTQLTFTGEATTINTAVSATTTRVEVTVDNTQDVVYKGALDMNVAAPTTDYGGKLSTLSGGTKTFEETVSVANMDLAGGDVTFKKNVTVGYDNGCVMTIGADTRMEGTLDLKGTGTLNADLTVKRALTLGKTGDDNPDSNSTRIEISAGKVLSTGNGTWTVTGTANNTRVFATTANTAVSGSSSAITIKNATLTYGGTEEAALNATLTNSSLATAAGAGKLTIGADYTLGSLTLANGTSVEVSSTGSVTTGNFKYENGTIGYTTPSGSSDASKAFSGTASGYTLTGGTLTLTNDADRDTVVNGLTIASNTNLVNESDQIMLLKGGSSESPVQYGSISSTSGNFAINENANISATSLSLAKDKAVNLWQGTFTVDDTTFTNTNGYNKFEIKHTTEGNNTFSLGNSSYTINGVSSSSGSISTSASSIAATLSNVSLTTTAATSISGALSNVNLTTKGVTTISDGALTGVDLTTEADATLNGTQSLSSLSVTNGSHTTLNGTTSVSGVVSVSGSTGEGDDTVYSSLTLNQSWNIGTASYLKLGGGSSITVSGAGNTLTHDNTAYSNGAVITSTNASEDAKDLSLYQGYYTVKGGDVTLKGGNRSISSQFKGSNVTYAGNDGGQLFLKGTQDIKTLTITSGKTTLAVGADNYNSAQTGDLTVGTMSGVEKVVVNNVGGNGGSITVTGKNDTSAQAIELGNKSVLNVQGSTASYKVSSGTLGTGSTVNLKADATTTNATITAGSGGELNNVTLSSSGIAGATSGEGADIRALGAMTSMTLAAAADISISNVTLYDSTINANGHSVTYSTTGGSRVMAVASTASTSGQQTRGVVPGPAKSGLDGNNSSTADSLTATTVQTGGTATGSLTVDVAYSLLDANRGGTLTWTILDGVDATGLTLQLGDVLTTLVQNGKPVVTLNVNGTPQDFATVDFKNADYNLLAGCNGLQHATVILTVENIPEPTTGVLSVLALAALAARRRRK